MPKAPKRFRRAPRLLKPFLRPAAYRILPHDLRARRVGRLAGSLPGGVRDPGFETLLKRIDDAPLFRGQSVTPFFDGPAAFAAMREAVAGAREEVLLEAYILRDDATGRDLAAALTGAAGRGSASWPTPGGASARAERSGLASARPGSASGSSTPSSPRSGTSRTATTGRSSSSTGASPSREG